MDSIPRLPVAGMLALLILMGFVLLSVSSASAVPVTDVELVPITNPGFEEGAKGWSFKKRYETQEIAVDRTVSHSGDASLRISGGEGENPWAAQRVDNLRGLTEYRLAAKVRSPEGESAAAAVKLEFYDANNHNVSGWYGKIRTETDGTWQTVERTATAQDTVVSVAIIVRLYGPGTLWFDDVELSVVTPGPALLALPNDIVATAEQASTVSFDVQLSQPAEKMPPLAFAIKSARLPAPVRPEARLDPANDRVIGVLLSVPALPPDLYSLEIMRGDTSEVGTANLVAIPANRQPETLRDDGVVLVEGEPFFPIEIYHVSTGHYEMLAAAGFNVMQGSNTHNLDSLQEMLDTAQEHGVKVMMSLYGDMKVRENLEHSVAKIKRFNDHPAVVGWKIMDEPSIHSGLREPVMEAYARLKALNSTKPFLLTICNPSQFGRWADFCDWLEVDYYPLPNGVMDYCRSFTIGALAALEPWQMMHTTVQAGWHPNLDNQPTVAQARMMVYLALIGGAKGIGWYSFRDRGWELDKTPLWEHFPAINAETLRLGTAVVNGEVIDVPCSDERIQCRQIKWDGKLYTMVANNSEESISARIQLKVVCTASEFLHAGTDLAESGMALRLSNNGRAVMFTLPAGGCDTIVSVLADGEEPAGER